MSHPYDERWQSATRIPTELPSLGEIERTIAHPAHYTAYGAEVIEITEHLNFCRGNAVKYICRAGLKDPSKEMEDLLKAQWYINREIARMERLAAAGKI